MRLTADEAFRAYGGRIFRAALSVCRNQADADDVVQDVMIRYHSLGQQYESEEHLKAWLLRVTINRARDITSSFWRRNKTSWEDCMEAAAFEDPADGRLFAAVMELPERYRSVIHLFYYEDYSVREIAEILHSREGTVKSQLNRGRALLKTKLKEEWDDDE